MFLEKNQVKINPYFLKMKGLSFLGYIPFGNNDYRFEYYTVLLEEKLTLESGKVVDHVGVIFEGVNESIWSDQEMEAKDLLKKNEEKLKEKKPKEKELLSSQSLEKYKKIIDNRTSKPYLLFFVGGDDQSSFLRFKNREDALNHLELADFFEDLADDKEIQYY